MSTVRLASLKVYDGAAFIPTTIYGKCRRGTSDASPAQNPPYEIIWIYRYEPLKIHRQRRKRVRTIESFLIGAEVLWADGIHDDRTVFQACLGRWRNLVLGGSAGDFDEVLSLTRTYKCDLPVGMGSCEGPAGAADTYMEITGPGGLTRTPYVSGLPQEDQSYFSSERHQPSWEFHDVQRLRLTSHMVNSWRRPSHPGGQDDVRWEAQHGIIGYGVIDFEVRNVTVQNVMGDGISTQFENVSPRIHPEEIRVYNCKIINVGRLINSLWAKDVDFYQNYCERNSASIQDIETLGSALMGNQLIRYNEYWNCCGVFFHIPAFAWTQRYCTATNGSTTLTSAGDSPSSRFNLADDEREMKNGQGGDKTPWGNGIQPGTIVSYVSQTQATMSLPASGVTQALGYRRIYQLIGSTLEGLTARGNVRHCANTFPSPGEVSIDGGGGVRLDGTYTFTDLLMEDNIWDRPNRGGAFIRLGPGPDGCIIRNNRGPFRKIYTDAVAYQLGQVFEPDGSPYTTAEVKADNPNVFRSPT